MKKVDYEDFVNKFKPKKTTDDCYTPPEIYEVVKEWACKRYGFNESCIIRPFYPGGNYQQYIYPEDCVVLDNPPFSILSEICAFYCEKGIRFFLFAPSLTLFSGKKSFVQTNHICCGVSITYENGAKVNTSFITNMDHGIAAQTAPDLYEVIDKKNTELQGMGKKKLSKYDYPINVATAAMLTKYAKYGVDFQIRHQDCLRIRGLDEQAKHGKAIFGGGLLLSEKAAAEKAAAEKAAAEKAAAEKYNLSEREWEIVRKLSEE